MRKIGQLAAVGSVGNASHASLAVPPDAQNLAFEFEITAAGATPTITFKLQGSQDDVGVPDASSDWFDISMMPSASDTSLATDTKTAVGVYEYFLEVARRSVAKLRLVTSANTNVTYEGELHVEEQE